jgi:hypothetical protein
LVTADTASTVALLAASAFFSARFSLMDFSDFFDELLWDDLSDTVSSGAGSGAALAPRRA